MFEKMMSTPKADAESVEVWEMYMWACEVNSYQRKS